eukprot:TRINITY_DN1491_c0_g1_i3.p1 TRINITY_DN1491_c0_g1~~TRINITY_DN1491_c0_g1_i3.p1  ORF type:complete len:481 (+),score=223.12 TRINITY_DN1491_c0_g1_i3:90-1532(+)
MVGHLLEKLRNTLFKRGTRGIVALGKWFHIADTDHSGALSRDEFVVTCKRMRVGLTEDEAHELFDHFDRDKSNSLSYDELLYDIRGEMNDFRKGIVMQAYRILDTNGDNTVTLDEMREKYTVSPNHPEVKSGKKTQEEVLLEFVETFEGEKSMNRGDGEITPEEFIMYYNDVSASIDRDDYFELMMNSAWRMGEYAKYSNKAKGTALEVGASPGRPGATKPPLSSSGPQRAAPRAVGTAPARTVSSAPAGAGPPSSAGGSAARRRAGMPNEVTVRMLKDRVKEVLKKRGTRGIASLGKWFLRSDLDKSGTLDRDEFAVVCKRLRVGLTPEQVQTLFDGFDHSGDGSITYDEFLHALRGELSPTRLKVTEQAWGKLLKFDRDGNGELSLDELREVYSAKGHPDVKSGKKTEEEVLLEFIETFEVGGRVDGTITKDEFIHYYKHISASIDDDAYYVLMMNSAWKMAEYANPDWKKKGSRMEI